MDVFGDTLGPRKGKGQLSGGGVGCIVFGPWGEPGEAGGFGDPFIWDPAERREPSFGSSSRLCWPGTVQKWVLRPHLPFACCPPLHFSLLSKELLQTSHPLCHFSLPTLKLALGERFLLLTVEQIVFNLIMEFPPVLLAPLTPSLLPPLHCDRISLSTE